MLGASGCAARSSKAISEAAGHQIQKPDPKPKTPKPRLPKLKSRSQRIRGKDLKVKAKTLKLKIAKRKTPSESSGAKESKLRCKNRNI